MGTTSQDQKPIFSHEGVIEGDPNYEIPKEEDIFIIQEHLSKPPRDPNFNNFFLIEKEELKKKLFEDKKYKNVIENGKYLNFDSKDIGILNNNRNQFNLKNQIIKSEKTIKVMEYKILDEIQKIKEDDEHSKINHLTILLAGIKGTGKTTLIKYILGIDKKNNSEIYIIQDKNFISYSKKNFPLKIIEFKGIGYDSSNSVEAITEEALNYIQELISRNKGNDYNNFVHCIWYLMSGQRTSEIEINFLKKLRSSYKDKNIPIIIVYNLYSKTSSIKMKEHLLKNCGDIDFVEVLPVDNKIMGSDEIKSSFGDKNLKEKTLLKCSQALEGDLIELMIEYISESVKSNILDKNKAIEKDIKEKIGNEIKDFKIVLTDEDLKQYIVNLFQKYIFEFYKGYNEKISNKGITLLNESSIIKSVEYFVTHYKKNFEKIINSKLDDIAKTLINKQANLEKDNKDQNKNVDTTLRLDYKRTLSKFKETTRVYFKRNYYYIAQKYLIHYIIQNVFVKFIECYRRRLDDITKDLLKDKNNKNIINNLHNCFLTKLKKFAENNEVSEVNIIINDKDIKKSMHSDLNNSQFVVELPPAQLRNNSIDLINDFNIDDNKEDENNNQTPGYEENNWFIYKENKWIYLGEKTALVLKKFLEDNMIYQEKYFEQKTDDKVFNLLKEYEKAELIKFFNGNYKEFVKNKICQQNDYNYIKIDRNKINDITSSKVFEEIYNKKMNNIIDSINSDLQFSAIKYLTIVVIGRSGVGKSTLINAFLKEEKAETDIGYKVTKENHLYDSVHIPFLRLYDTRGIELDEQFGPKSILDNALSIINTSESKNDFNDYVSCIWYCVTGNYIDDKEIEIIRNLKKEKPSIPLIIVYSFALLQEGFKTIRTKIIAEFPNALFIPVLAKKEENYYSFGLDTLLEKTIELCKNGLLKGKFYQTMRRKLSRYIEGKFKKEHELLKINSIEKITINFVNKYVKVLTDEQLFSYIYDLFESLFLEYLKIDDLFDKNNISPDIQKSLKDLADIKKDVGIFIKYYKRETKKIVDSIKDQKALEFIDKQVYLEKKETKSINKKNKSNINDFIQIIENFLKDNYYYVSQKYIIYRIITDSYVCEDICSHIEKNVNKLVYNLLYKNPYDILQKIFIKKFEDYEKLVNKFRINNKIYNDLENDLSQTMKDFSSAPAAIPNL